MTPFEFVFFLYAILLTLGLTHLVGGWASALRGASSVRWSLPPVLWALAALMLTVGNLTSFWLMHDAPRWTSWLVLTNFAFSLSNYVWCVLLTPDGDRGEVLDLPAFHEREKRRYLGALVVLTMLALVFNVVNGLNANYENWKLDAAFSAAALVVTCAAIISAQRWIQWVSAIAVLVMTGVFVIVASNIFTP